MGISNIPGWDRVVCFSCITSVSLTNRAVAVSYSPSHKIVILVSLFCSTESNAHLSKVITTLFSLFLFSCRLLGMQRQFTTTIRVDLANSYK